MFDEYSTCGGACPSMVHVWREVMFRPVRCVRPVSVRKRHHLNGRSVEVRKAQAKGEGEFLAFPENSTCPVDDTLSPSLSVLMPISNLSPDMLLGRLVFLRSLCDVSVQNVVGYGC